MKLDLLDAAGTVVRFPVERREAADICLAARLAALDELWGGVLDHGAETDWPDWKGEGAAGVAALVDDLAAQGAAADAVLAAAREHVAALVKTAVARGWAYQDAAHTADLALKVLAASRALGPAADPLGRLAADVERTEQAWHAAAAASCETYLLACGAHEALENLAAGRGARVFTKAELEAAHLALLDAIGPAMRRAASV